MFNTGDDITTEMMSLAKGMMRNTKWCVLEVDDAQKRYRVTDGTTFDKGTRRGEFVTSWISFEKAHRVNGAKADFAYSDEQR